MDFSSLIDFLENFETSRVWAKLRELNLQELIHNPWFLGTMVAIALLALILRWRVVLALVLSITGFVGLISLTLEKGTDLETLGGESLLFFVGGAVCLMAVVIYLLFIRAD